MKISQAEHAIIVSRLVRIQEELAVINDILLPADDDGSDQCKHLDVEHEESMDDEEHPYICKDCGAVSKIPFTPGG